MLKSELGPKNDVQPRYELQFELPPPSLPYIYLSPFLFIVLGSLIRDVVADAAECARSKDAGSSPRSLPASQLYTCVCVCDDRATAVERASADRARLSDVPSDLRAGNGDVPLVPSVPPRVLPAGN